MSISHTANYLFSYLLHVSSYFHKFRRTGSCMAGGGYVAHREINSLAILCRQGRLSSGVIERALHSRIDPVQRSFASGRKANVIRFCFATVKNDFGPNKSFHRFDLLYGRFRTQRGNQLPYIINTLQRVSRKL